MSASLSHDAPRCSTFRHDAPRSATMRHVASCDVYRYYKAQIDIIIVSVYITKYSGLIYASFKPSTMIISRDKIVRKFLRSEKSREFSDVMKE